MKNDILEFKKQLVTTKTNQEYNSTLKHTDYLMQKETYTFHVCSEWHYPNGYIMGGSYRHLINLDEEDILYFMNKYLPKLDIEMEDKIAKIKEDYGEVSRKI
jgi:hypothetical protein